MALTADKFLIPNGSPVGDGQPVISSSAGTVDVFRRAIIGYADYNHGGGTQSLTANTWTVMTNNAAGPYTDQTHLPTEVDPAVLWSPASNRFGFTDLNVGDMIDLRFDLTITPASANTEVLGRLVFDVGQPGEFSLNVLQKSFKSASVYQVVGYTGFYIGSLSMRNNPCKFELRGDSNLTVQVNGWYVKVILGNRSGL